MDIKYLEIEPKILENYIVKYEEHIDIEDYNKRMVEFGFAVPYWKYIKSKKLKDEYQKLLLKAKKGNRGVWKAYPEVLECMDERR
jgi:endonuclease YncB( thermonuclease family)